MAVWAAGNWIPLTLLILCLSTVAPIALRAGWPFNHEYASLFERVEAFRREFAAGNLFPLWTPYCFNGHGSPMPFFYHRLFNSIAGLLALLLGTVTAVKLALAGVLFAGALGMVAAARELRCPPWVQVWCGATLVVAPYTFTNWLVRGSGAELTAGMLAAWLIAVCLRALSGKPFGARLGGVLVLLFYAHVVIFLYSLLLMTITVLCRVAVSEGARRAAIRQLARGIGPALAIVAVGAGAYAGTIGLLKHEFNLGKLAIYLPQNEFAATERYLVDNFVWGQTWHGLSVEIGRAVVVGVLLTAVVVMARRARVAVGALSFLVTGVLAYFAFQLPAASSFFIAVPISQILQFPWRLLVFITPLLILILAFLSTAILGLGGRWTHLAVAVLAATWAAEVGLAMPAYRTNYDWLTPDTLKHILTDLNGPFAAGEFLPRPFGDRLDPPPRTPLFRLDGCKLVSSSVDLRRLETTPFQTVELALESPHGCTLHFSQFQSSLIQIEPSAGGQVVRAPDLTTDIVLPAGASTVRVNRRGLLRTFVHLLRDVPAG